MHREHESSCTGERGRGGGVAVWLDAATLLSLAAFLVFSYYSGRLRFFIAPAYLWLPPLAAAVLTAMGVARLASRDRGSATACGCAAQSGPHASRVVCAAVLLIPVGLALGVDPKEFSSEGVGKRSLRRPSRDVALERAVRWVLGEKAAGPTTADGDVALPKNPTLVELLDAAAVYDPETLDGRFVTVVGQCNTGGEDGGERFILYRLIVTCCVADASAVSVEVVGKPAAKVQDRQWVRAGGILRFDSAVDPGLPVIHATAVAPIAEPLEPYL
ncbi:MAG: TIGR03943 family putative permease subunit [Planctomycetota bacterium]|jgi:putative membrane protein